MSSVYHHAPDVQIWNYLVRVAPRASDLTSIKINVTNVVLEKGPVNQVKFLASQIIEF